MSFFDNLESNAEEIAGKAGISADQVKSLSATIQSKLGDGSNQMEALEAAAGEHGIPVDKVREVLGHAGDSGDMMAKIGGFAGGLFKS